MAQAFAPGGASEQVSWHSDRQAEVRKAGCQCRVGLSGTKDGIGGCQNSVSASHRDLGDMVCSQQPLV